MFELRKYILTRTRLRSVTLAITIYIYIYHVRPPPRAFLWTPHRTTLQTWGEHVWFVTLGLNLEWLLSVFMIIKHFVSFLENNPGAFAWSSNILTRMVLPLTSTSLFLSVSSFIFSSLHLDQFWGICLYLMPNCKFRLSSVLSILSQTATEHRTTNFFYDQHPWTMFSLSQMDLSILLVQGQWWLMRRCWQFCSLGGYKASESMGYNRTERS